VKEKNDWDLFRTTMKGILIQKNFSQMRLYFLFLLFFTAIAAWGQTVVETYPKTLWCPNDTFVLHYKDFPEDFPYRVSREDKSSPGTDAKPDEHVTIYYGNDSLRLNYHNKIPYAHIIYINFASPKGTTTLRFHYNELASYFPKSYIEQNMGNIQFDIPEVYELANIIWTLSPSGAKAKDLNRTGAYYQKVLSHFQPYLDHPIFKSLDVPDTAYANNYYSFRENSFAFNFEDPGLNSAKCKLMFNGPYYYVYGDDLADSSLFGKMKHLVEDFALKSNFKQFYKSNENYYKNSILRQRELLPVKQMWDWLERQFPTAKYQSYRVVFSPLIGGSHSTQHYVTDYNSGLFREIVLFVCNTDCYDSLRGLSEKQKEGLMSGIVFTEIDHNYVNSVTSKYTQEVDNIFSKRSLWARKGNSSDFYDSPESVFNEYMTHAVFCLYVLETYDKQTADFIIGNRENLMVNRRNFIRFKEFDQELIKLKQAHKDLKVVDLYPLILAWCRKQI
jgi:hypothetical protein